MKKQRVVVVTGGGSGMGRAAAYRFSTNGDKVFILGRRVEKLNETAEGHANITGLQADVTDPKSVKQALEAILEHHKTIDVLVNCAGGTAKLGSDASTEEQLNAWNQIINVNLTSVFIVINLFDEHMTRPGARIINVTSLAAFSGSRQPGVTGQAYSAAKSGVHGLTRTLVGRFSGDGVTINSVAPGVVQNTDFFPRGEVPDALADYYLSRTPLGRIGEPEEIAAGIFYLASDEAGFITGEILNINGGVQFGR